MNKLLTALLTLFVGGTTISAQPIGIQLYSLNKELRTDLHGTLSEISSWGISNVEISENYGLNNSELRAALDSHQLHAVSVPANFAELERDPMAIVRAANELGAKYAVCYWTPHPLGEFAEIHIQNAVRVLSKAGNVLAENGIQLCYHPHWYELAPFLDGTYFDYLDQNTDAHELQFELDVFWIKFAGYDPSELLAKYGKRTPIIHLKDRVIGSDLVKPDQAYTQNTILGQGEIDIAGIIQTAKQIGTVKYLIIEDESSQAQGNIPAGIEFLNKAIQQTGADK